MSMKPFLNAHPGMTDDELRFIRELEQGKETVRMDKVNAALAMFDMEAVPGRIERDGK